MRFKLAQKSQNRVQTKFHVIDSATGDILGSANIPNDSVSGFLRCWSGPSANASPQPQQQQSPADALAAAFMRDRRPASKASLLRGCNG